MPPAQLFARTAPYLHGFSLQGHHGTASGRLPKSHTILKFKSEALKAIVKLPKAAKANYCQLVYS